MWALLPPFSAEGGTAALSSFLFFAEDVGLINQGRASGNDEHKQGSKGAWWVLLVVPNYEVQNNGQFIVR